MTLNILFMTITINKRQRSSEEINHDVQVSKYFEETKIKNESMISKMF
ncbi:YrzI family small protein [Rossellomorea sp. BNER]|nr:YrzI family small protein [Rossellomorea sp. BNER]